MKPRQPRPPAPATGLQASYIEAEEDLIVRTVMKWRELKADLLTPEGTHANFEECFFNILAHPESVEDASIVVRIARHGHPAADLALRRFIAAAMDAHKFPELPLCVQEYAREGIRQTPLAAGYSSKLPQIANHYARDVAICYCMDRVRARYPAVPLYKMKKRRRSAADLVGQAFGPGEAQCKRIHQADGGIALRIAEFFAWPVDKMATNEFLAGR